MAYTHSGKKPAALSGDPADPDGTDWVFFSYQDWLREGETIVAHAATVAGGELVTDSVYIGAIPDTSGVTFNDVYGVQFKPATGARTVTITHRVSTSTSGADLARVDMDRTITIPVKSL